MACREPVACKLALPVLSLGIVNVATPDSTPMATPRYSNRPPQTTSRFCILIPRSKACGSIATIRIPGIARAMAIEHAPLFAPMSQNTSIFSSSHPAVSTSATSGSNDRATAKCHPTRSETSTVMLPTPRRKICTGTSGRCHARGNVLSRIRCFPCLMGRHLIATESNFSEKVSRRGKIPFSIEHPHSVSPASLEGFVP